jgi:hypothetical protein
MALSRWAQSLAGVVLIGGAASAFSMGGCVEAESRFYVECVQGEAAALCTSDCDVFLNEGSYNTASCVVGSDGQFLGGCGFFLPFVLVSNMSSSTETEANNNRAETGTINVYAYDVEIDGIDVPGIEGFTVLAPLPPGPDSRTCVFVNLIPGDVVVEETVTVVASVKFYGRTTGGLEVETPTNYFSITLFSNEFDCSCEEGSGDGERPGSNGVPLLCDPSRAALFCEGDPSSPCCDT